MSYQTVIATVEDDVGILTLDRPERLNALTPAMAEEIVDALQGFPSRGARAVLLQANGKGFCSGTDLHAGEGGGIPDDAGEILERSYNPALLSIIASPLPMVAAVHGACAGVGMSLALTADFVLAARSAYFLQAFVNVGLVPDGGSTWHLPRLVGRARAVRMMMLGERISANQAEDWGLIYAAVDDDSLNAEALGLARRLARGPTRALGLIRKGLASAQESSLADTLRMERAHQANAGDSSDFKEGLASFLEKRPAVFTGN
jgi:2-(1,2-epoxy-1,2-dihydrophenyl)acetyl-CoA isomerase